ncbi:MAG TPA: hypothetical protein VK636_04865 [Gemmatimonadaceae bacterium]|nr:hypothetical protein [Gemmatimonadaceae bacterium]
MPSLLPTVLAGPIVRRVEPTLCSFWIALSDPSDAVTATIWSGLQVAGATAGTVVSGNAKVGSATVKTRRFGKRLHVALVTIKLTSPTPPLSPGAIYAYDIQIGSNGLQQLGMLVDEDPASIPVDLRPHRVPGLALGYVAGRLPSFVTPPPLIEQTRFAHGSCRNSIATHYDALAYLDDTISHNLTDPTQRPQQLFMTGDQIYADDLAASYLYMISQLAGDVIGTTEQMHVVATNQQAGITGKPPTDIAIDKQFVVNLDNFPAMRRLSAVVKLGGYTTGDGDNHLLSYGEYVAMYLAAWSPRVWSALGTADQTFLPLPPGAIQLWPFLDKPENEKPYDGDIGKLHEAENDPFSDFSIETKCTELYRTGVPRVARALANVATYMIFDDHDVTDDWNLHGNWVNRVYSKAFGRQLVRNGVMAYAVFQGWGNDPVAFETGKNKELLDEIEKLYGADDGAYPLGPTDRVDTLTGVSGAAFTEQAVWNYIVPAPKMQVIVLDTRTRRKFTGQEYLPADLVGLNREAQIPAGPSTDGREVVFVISAAPVFGPDFIEQLAWPLAQVAIDAVHFGKGLDATGFQQGDVGVEKFDAEGWSSNDAAREDLLKRLATYPRVVLLGGDVHFSYTATLDYYKDGAPAPSRIVQLTASPLRNVAKPEGKLLMRQNAFLQTLQTEFSIARLAWNQASPIKIPPDAFVSAGRRGRMVRAPSLLPAGGWPAGTVIPVGAPPPDWRWRMQLQRDVRPDSVRPAPLRQPALAAASELNEADALPAYRAITTRHQTMAATRFEFLRQIVFQSNVAVVRLSKPGTDVVLQHVLISQSAPDSVTGAENTVHEVSLAASKEPPPGVEFR